MREQWVVRSLVLLLAMASACDSSGGPSPVARVVLEPATSTIAVGARVQYVARVLDGDGGTLGNRPLTWAVERPDIASIDAGGNATALAPGVTQVRATSGGKTGTASLTVLPAPVAVVTLAPPTATLARGGTLRLTVDLRDVNGYALAGREVVWSSGAPQVATVSTNGTVSALAEGTATITASSEGKHGVSTVTVLATGLSPTIDSLTPSVLTPGTLLTIIGTHLATDAFPAVTVAGEPASVLSATATRVQVAVPCVRRGAADLVVRVVGTEATRRVDVETPQRSLVVGQAFIATTGVESTCNELLPVSGSSKYLVTVFSTAGSPNTVSDFALQGNDGGPSVASTFAPVASPATWIRDPAATRDSVHALVMERDRAEYARLRRRARPQPRASSRVAAAPPVVGELRNVRLSVFGGCDDASQVAPARVLQVGARAVIWEDTTNSLEAARTPELDSFYRRLGMLFDLEQYDIVRRYFGDPLLRDGETDGDGRVHMVFTQRLNNTGIGAYVSSCDQFPPAEVPASNGGEYFYAMVPVLSGSNRTNLSYPDGWFSYMSHVVPHEVKHIASIAARYRNGAAALDARWIEEGSAGHAEELWVRGNVHRVPWKSNAGFGTAPSNGLYCDFHIDNPTCLGAESLRRPGEGLQRHFDGMRDKMLEPWNWSAYGDGIGQRAGVFYRTAWSLIRYAADRYASSEEAFFSALTNSTLTGGASLELATGVPNDRMLGAWGLALYADDLPGLEGFPDLNIASWNTRDVYAGISASPLWRDRWPNAWALRALALPGGSFTTQQSGLRGGAHAYFELSGPLTSSQLLALRDFGASLGSPTLRIAVLRLP